MKPFSNHTGKDYYFEGTIKKDSFNISKKGNRFDKNSGGPDIDGVFYMVDKGTKVELKLGSNFLIKLLLLLPSIGVSYIIGTIIVGFFNLYPIFSFGISLLCFPITLIFFIGCLQYQFKTDISKIKNILDAKLYR